MAVSAKQIKGKISSVQNVGKITKAMELVSVSKMQKSIDSLHQTRPYAEEALSVLSRISTDDKRDHALLSHGKNDKNLVVLISSNRGLCGSYNARIAKAATEYLNRTESKHGSKIEFVCVGRYAETIARRLRREIRASFQDFDESSTYGDTIALAKVIHDLFESGDYWNVVVIYTDFVSTLVSRPLARQLLPVKSINIENMLVEKDDPSRNLIKDFEPVDMEFEPTESEVLEFVLRRLTDAQIYHALRESLASEHSSRMVAMKNATENADKLADELKLTYNRARQAAITQEISEIASGAEALK
jgi:F-type H+-transporting ATPase subunit gamma